MVRYDRRPRGPTAIRREAANDDMTKTWIWDFGAQDVRGGFPAFFYESSVCVASGLW